MCFRISKRIIKGGLFCVVAVSLLTAGLLLSCNHDSPVKPDEPKDYAVYFTEGQNDRIYYEYHPSTGVLDSFTLDRRITWGLAASADGRLLYVNGYTATSVYDLETRNLVKEFPAVQTVSVSPDNHIVALHGYPTLRLVTAEDYSTLYEDTLHTWGGTFTADGKRFYYCAEHPSLTDSSVTDYFVGVVGTDTGLQDRVIDPPAHDNYLDVRIQQVRPSLDESVLFLLRQVGDFSSYFEVYDVAGDSDIFVQAIQPGGGGLVISNDERYAICTNPSSMLDWGPPAEPEFYVFDMQNGYAMRTISGADCPGLDSVLTTFGGVAKTPDGKWLLVGGIEEPVVLVINLETMEVVDCLDMVDRIACSFTAQTGL